MLAAINDSLKTCEYSTSSIGVPEIRHFLYKSKTAAQVYNQLNLYLKVRVSNAKLMCLVRY